MSQKREKSNETMRIIEELLSIVYCRSVFADFRKPVAVMYPHLSETYDSLVKTPMDLGTLLLRSYRHELSVDGLRNGLQLVHGNCLLFNEGAAMMESISMHLEMFCAGLFEEMIQEPYHLPGKLAVKTSKGKAAASAAANQAAATVTAADFVRGRLQRRRHRFAFVAKEPLNLSEMQRLQELLSQGDLLRLTPPTVRSVVAKSVGLLSNTTTAATDGSSSSSSAGVLTLYSLLEPIISACSAKGAAAAGGENSGTFPNPEGPISPDNHPTTTAAATAAAAAVSEGCEEFMRALDEALGVLLVCMEERCLRGLVASCVWALPGPQFVWAQSISNIKSARDAARAAWWPCMVIACDASSYQEADELEDRKEGANTSTSNAVCMSETLVRCNLHRLPTDIVKQLKKLRPRGVASSGSTSTSTSTSTSASAPTTAAPAMPTIASDSSEVTSASSVKAEAAAAADAGGSATTQQKAQEQPPLPLEVPEGYVLLEYFGAHDFGWVKREAVMPMYTLQGAPCQLPPKPANHDVVREAVDAWRSLQKRRKFTEQSQSNRIQTSNSAAVGSGVDVKGVTAPADNTTTTSRQLDASSTGTGTGSAEEEDAESALFASVTTTQPPAAVLESSPGGGGGGAAGGGTSPLDSQLDLSAAPSQDDLKDTVEIPLFKLQQSLLLKKRLAAQEAERQLMELQLLETAQATAGGAGGAGVGRGGASRGSARNSLLSGGGGEGPSDSLLRLGAAGTEGRLSRNATSRMEQLQKYRADVEYIPMEDVSPADYQRCVTEDGLFRTSQCPLPLQPSADLHPGHLDQQQQQQQRQQRQSADETADRAEGYEATNEAMDVEESKIEGDAAHSNEENEDENPNKEKEEGPQELPVAEIVNVDARVRQTFRGNAIMRANAFSYFLNVSKPLQFEHYSALKAATNPTAVAIAKDFVGRQRQKQMQRQFQRGTGTGSSIPGAGTSTSSRRIPQSWIDSVVIGPPEDPDGFREFLGDDYVGGVLLQQAVSTTTGGSSLLDAKIEKQETEGLPIKPEKRKYVFKNPRPPKNLQLNGANCIPGSGGGASSEIHIPQNLAASSSVFHLDSGSSRLSAGEGSVYTRAVNLQAKVFNREDKSREKRKHLLSEELAQLERKITQMQQSAKQRHEKDNEHRAMLEERTQGRVPQQQSLERRQPKASKPTPASKVAAGPGCATGAAGTEAAATTMAADSQAPQQQPRRKQKKSSAPIAETTAISVSSGGASAAAANDPPASTAATTATTATTATATAIDIDSDMHSTGATGTGTATATAVVVDAAAASSRRKKAVASALSSKTLNRTSSVAGVAGTTGLRHTMSSSTAAAKQLNSKVAATINAMANTSNIPSSSSSTTASDTGSVEVDPLTATTTVAAAVQPKKKQRSAPYNSLPLPPPLPSSSSTSNIATTASSMAMNASSSRNSSSSNRGGGGHGATTAGPTTTAVVPAEAAVAAVAVEAMEAEAESSKALAAAALMGLTSPAVVQRSPIPGSGNGDGDRGSVDVVSSNSTTTSSRKATTNKMRRLL